MATLVRWEIKGEAAPDTNFLGAESVCQAVFHKTKGLLNFLDIRNMAENRRSQKDVRAQGFEILRDFLEKMIKHNLLKSYAHVTKEIKDICLDTYKRENYVKIKENALEPLSVVLKYSKGRDGLSSDEAVKLFNNLLYSLTTAKTTSSDSKSGVKKAVFTILGLMCRNYPENVRTTTFEKGNKTLLVTFLDRLNSYIGTDVNKVRAGCFDGLNAVLESLPEDALAYEGGKLLENAYKYACQSLDVNVSRYELPVAALNLLSKHSRILCPWFFKNELDATKPTKVCGNILAASNHNNSELRRAAMRALDSWLGCLRHCMELSTESTELAKLINFFTKEFSAQGESRQVVVAIRGYGALAWAMSDLQERYTAYSRLSAKFCIPVDQHELEACFPCAF